jgi:hypothetical protein
VLPPSRKPGCHGLHFGRVSGLKVVNWLKRP